MHRRTGRWRVALATGDLRVNLGWIALQLLANLLFVCWLFWGARNPRVVPSSKRHSACYQMPRPNASRAQHALYLRLFMPSTLCSFRKPPPSWANSFAHTDVSPNPFGSVTTRHQTPDNWQAAIIRKLRHCWASLGWTCRHRHFRMTRIRKRRFCKARLRKGQYNSTTIDAPGLHLWLATSASVARQNNKAKYGCGLPCAVHGTAAPSRSLWHFARATCLFAMKIAGSKRQREALVWRCPHTIEAKVQGKKNLSFSKYPIFEISRGGVSALFSWQNIIASCLQPNALATSGSESFVTYGMRGALKS